MGAFFSTCSPWKVGIDAFGIPSPGSWLDRMIVVHFNLDYSYPNMKNSDNGTKFSTCFYIGVGLRDFFVTNSLGENGYFIGF